MADSLTGTISDLENQTWQALQSKGSDMLPFLTADCIMLFPLGMKISNHTAPSIKDVMTSEAFVPWSTYRMSDVAVTPVGPEAAVISYRVKATRAGSHGRDEKFSALISSVWRREPATGQWQMCSHQQTPYEKDIEDLVGDD